MAAGKSWVLWLTLIAAALLPAQAQEVFYIHTDALGTVVAETDANGNVVQRSEYEPYGKVLNRPVKNGPGYTGHVEDAATGLTYMQQRYYDPGVGRFLSRDPVSANPNTGANFNAYWYANNNPYKFIDPDGRLGCAGSRIKSVCDGGGVAALRTSARSPLDTGAASGGGRATSSAINVRPVEGSINRRSPPTADGGFDPDGAKKLRSGGARGHKGIDVAAEPGTPVQAAGPGTVQNRNEPAGFGIYVDLNHGRGLLSRYAHLSGTTRASGEAVDAGDVIGYTGTSGNLPSGAKPHLHFEIRLNGAPQDPTTYLDYSYGP